MVVPTEKIRFFSATLLILALAGGRGAAEVDEGLLAHYAFDSGATDSSGNGYHAASHGARATPEGRIGGAFAFDGADDFVSLPPDLTRDRDRFTIALWLKTEDAGSKPPSEFWRNPTVLGAATPTPGSRDLGLILRDGKAAYHHGLRRGRDTCFFTAIRVSDGEWHHVALACDGRVVRLYVDGRLFLGEVGFSTGQFRAAGAAMETPAGERLGDAPLFVGAANDSSEPAQAEHFFRGLVDDLSVWSRALSPKEVASLWTAVTGHAVEIVEPPAPRSRTPGDAGPVISSIVLESGQGLRWALEQRPGGWALGSLSLRGKPLEAPVRSGAIALRNLVTEEILWPAAMKGEKLDPRSARLSGRDSVDGAGFSFEVTASLAGDLPAATLDARWKVDRRLDGWEVCLAWHEGFEAPWRCHLYPFAENSERVACQPLTYVGAPAALLCREDLSSAVLFGIDIRSDYLDPNTWTGTTGFHFESGVTPPQFRVCAGQILPEVDYRLPLQLVVADRVVMTNAIDTPVRNVETDATVARVATVAGDPLASVTALVRAWMRLNNFRVEPLSVRTPDEALSIYLEGRRTTGAWKPGQGYVLQPGAWDAIYLGTTPESAYFEYRIYEQTGDELWRRRAFEQLDFTLRAQERDPGSRHHGAMHTCYDLSRGAFNSDDRGVNKGYKPDLIAHMARYMLLAWKRVKDHEGIDRRDWYEAAARAADWVVLQRNDDGGLPQKVDVETGARSNSVVSGRALPALPVIAAITGERRYLECVATMERFLREKVERRLWFTGQHPDLPPNDYESDSVWGVIEYWLDKYERTREMECLERAVADAHLSLLWWCPKQLSWVKHPTQCAHAEQQNYLQYSLYCYHNRKIECLERLAKLTGDPLFKALYERVLQAVFWTQKADGDLMGAMYERVCDPWRARGGDFNSLGTLYLNELSLDAMVQIVDMGIARPRRPR